MLHHVLLLFILIMSILVSTFLVTSEYVQYNSTYECPNIKNQLGNLRRRRHLNFPDGSNVILTISLVKAFMTHAPAGWNIALEIDVLYPLPDSKFTAAHLRRKLHHRQKRELWERLKEALDFHNLNGHSCVLQSICDAMSGLAPPGKSLVHDILRAVFTAPLHEEDFVDEVNATYNELLDPDVCSKVHDCPFSLLHFVTFNK
ncbi:uncharacterized protein LOC113234863 [Hyposmocoma kahamanoa]|uniref:uncharacterized protein LOC113234863 n=1 Tax=Hyposmocoma kahamanoa TaxID=1477025 RepID=UPI000E6D992C|nr:uncharacterized protein LOC113234863 [Hyposmocoma kahamanoa]